MLTIPDQIRELRAELVSCALTRRERARAEVELGTLLAALAEDSTAFTTAPAEDVPSG